MTKKQTDRALSRALDQFDKASEGHPPLTPRALRKRLNLIEDFIDKRHAMALVGDDFFVDFAGHIMRELEKMARKSARASELWMLRAEEPKKLRRYIFNAIRRGELKP